MPAPRPVPFKPKHPASVGESYLEHMSPRLLPSPAAAGWRGAMPELPATGSSPFSVHPDRLRAPITERHECVMGGEAGPRGRAADRTIEGPQRRR